MDITSIERAILSSIIFDPTIYEDIAIVLKPKDFYHPFHQNLFQVMEELFREDQPIDEEFLKEKLELKNQFDENEFLEVLAANPLSNTSAYIQEIKEKSIKRQLDHIVTKFKLKNEKGETVSNLIAYLENELEILQQKGIITREPKSLLDIIHTNQKPNIIYSTGLCFLDDVLGGGFETGQLVTITGEQEAGKTQLVNQILLNISAGFRSLYFSLEFNERQLAEYMKKKIKTCNINIEKLKNIKVVTDEMTTGDIDDILTIIKQEHKKNGTKFVIIDSQMMLYEDDPNMKYTTGEERATSIFRKLHNISKKLDILILLIAQSSKDDAKSRKIEIFGSKKAAHLARIMIHINYNRDKDAKNGNGERELFIAKNKQNGKIAKIPIFFDREKLEFRKEKESETNRINPIKNNKNIKEQDDIKTNNTDELPSVRDIL